MTQEDNDTSLGFRSPQVCAVVGITYRQLDYWDRSGLLGPSMQSATGSGTQRLYTFQDIVTLRVVKRLKDAGTSLHKIRAAFDQLEEQVGEGGAKAISRCCLMDQRSTRQRAPKKLSISSRGDKVSLV